MGCGRVWQKLDHGFLCLGGAHHGAIPPDIYRCEIGVKEDPEATPLPRVPQEHSFSVPSPIAQGFLLVKRETSSGISLGAFFISQNAIDLIWVFLAPAVFLGPYYYMTLPVSAEQKQELRDEGS